MNIFSDRQTPFQDYKARILKELEQYKAGDIKVFEEGDGERIKVLFTIGD